MASIYSERELDGLDYFVILGEDPTGQTPSAEYCKQYAEQGNIDPAKMLIDASWQTTFANIDTGQAGGIGLPWDAVIDSDDGMLYMWNDSVPTPSNAYGAVEELLAQ